MSKSKLNTAARMFALVCASIFGGAFALFIVGCVVVVLVNYGMYFVELATR